MIETVADLRAHLVLATRIELSTIPPYLYAMYSIQDQGSEAARLIASVVVEEMLHVCLTANLLTAIGGQPDFSPSAMPRYPCVLPHHRPPLRLELRRCTPALVRETFMVIEQPRPPGAPSEDDEYETLGQFYGALEMAIGDLDSRLDLFADHRPDLQVADHAFYRPVEFDADDSGGLVLVHDLDSAMEALEIIVHQGEGVTESRYADPDHRELTHYYKFEQISSGVSAIGPTWPTISNPTQEALPIELRPVSALFDAVYGLVYVTLGNLYAGRSDQGSLIGRLYALMVSGLRPIARYLVRQPVGPDRTAGPSFAAPAWGGDPWEETTALAESVQDNHPELAPVAEMLAGFEP
jgi:hypothetical protein